MNAPSPQRSHSMSSSGLDHPRATASLPLASRPPSGSSPSPGLTLSRLLAKNAHSSSRGSSIRSSTKAPGAAMALSGIAAASSLPHPAASESAASLTQSLFSDHELDDDPARCLATPSPAEMLRRLADYSARVSEDNAPVDLVSMWLGAALAFLCKIYIWGSCHPVSVVLAMPAVLLVVGLVLVWASFLTLCALPWVGLTWGVRMWVAAFREHLFASWHSRDS
eukprot:RCo040214